MKIGLVDLDTSHPESFVPLLRARGHEVTGVWDGGSVHPSGYAREFAKTHGIPKVFDALDDMAEQVDCAFVHGCDWDTHIAKARPFLEANKGVFLDKPLVGNSDDLEILAGWIAKGRRVTGGSALLYCQEAADWRTSASPERGDLLTVFCGCGVDEFNYGIHGYALALALAGFDVASARHFGMSGRQDIIELSHAGGARTLLQIGAADAWLPYHATLVTTRQVRQILVDPQKLYASALDATLPYLEGKTDSAPLPTDAFLMAERCALAARLSKQSGGRTVLLSERLDASYNGAAFAQSYRAMKYP